jgi:PKD repeat protein
VVSYAWDFGDGTASVGAEPSAFKTYSRPGRYTATVLVSDDLGQRGTAATAVIVGDAFTFPEPAFTISPAAPGVGTDVTFTASGVVAANGLEVTQYLWDFGDGGSPARTSQAAIRHEFLRTGTYVVRLTVMDTLGRSSTKTREVTVK